ncbi:PepSY domain-containing protein [Rothia sp. ZJ1223]|uniref:PepSY domain-containing protein n=1 Tax=Rothia sp. ZJ1223 TaxID=2811098 RepID=UPI00195EF4BF|nr:PepSY domain-containing protein [Rothia sp. ZJ1223]MBM7051782.1 PepSY domain-containing protein [Rothia sp. ZJ1223]
MMKKTTYAATGIFALLALSACGSNTAEPAPEVSTVTVTAEAPASTPTADANTSNAAAKTSAASSATSQSPVSKVSRALDVAGAVDAVRKAHPNAQIVSISADDDSDHWDVSAVEDNKELDIHIHGTQVELEDVDVDHDSDSDDIRDAGEARVDIKDAIATAQGEKSGEEVESVSLDRIDAQNNRLVWEVSFDVVGNDDEVDVDAVTGEVVTR